MMKDGRPQRRFDIDLIRALAMLGIVFTHVMTPYVDRSTEVIVKMFMGSAALFFMTSGALILPVKMPARQFMWRRLRTFLPQFIIWSGIYAWLGWRYVPDYDLARHLTWVLFYPTWGAGWFIYALIGLYLFAPVISPWIARASRRSIELFLGVWLLTGFLPLAIANTDLAPQESIFGCFYNFMGFMVAGYYLTRWPVGQRPFKQQLVFWAGTFVIAVPFGLRMLQTASRWGYDWIMTYDLGINTMAMVMLWFALFGLARRAPRWLSAPVKLVSTCSLGIYLSHIALLDYVFLPQHWGLWPTFGAVAVSATAIAWLTHKLGL